MLASITPLGERGRHTTYGVTVAAFVIAATAAGAAIGALAGGLGRLVFGADPGTAARAGVLAAGLLAGLALDLRSRGGRLPGPRRQVSEDWLTAYRGWVYGAGFGAQLGVGVATRVNASATYVAVLAALVTARPAPGALVLGCYGLVRGATLLAGVRVRTPADLAALHARLTAADAPARRAALAGQAVLAAVLVAVAL